MMLCIMVILKINGTVEPIEKFIDEAGGVPHRKTGKE